MDIRVINIRKKADLIHELHAYRIIAQMNDYYFKLVKAKRGFVWHRHPETDEVFICIQGSLKSNYATELLLWMKGIWQSSREIQTTGLYARRNAA